MSCAILTPSPAFSTGRPERGKLHSNELLLHLRGIAVTAAGQDDSTSRHHLHGATICLQSRSRDACIRITHETSGPHLVQHGNPARSYSVIEYVPECLAASSLIALRLDAHAMPQTLATWNAGIRGVSTPTRKSTNTNPGAQLGAIRNKPLEHGLDSPYEDVNDVAGSGTIGNCLKVVGRELLIHDRSQAATRIARVPTALGSALDHQDVRADIVRLDGG